MALLLTGLAAGELVAAAALATTAGMSVGEALDSFVLTNGLMGA
jgi:hypothetical protein